MCASEMPMNAPGSDSFTQLPKFFIPMPGSISTGTAPALNSAKVSAKKSRLGRTISTVRTPGPIPALSNPRASKSLSVSSWRNV